MGERAKTLVVIRHAKAEQVASSDMARPLTEQGAADAGDAGRWLAANGVVAEHALVSSAQRTQDTWTALAAAAGWDLATEPDSGLYSSGADTVLDVIREVPESAATVVVIGHNPTMAYLAQMLSSGDGDREAESAMDGGFPTCSVAVFSYDGAWADLDEAGAEVTGFHVGRG